MAKTRTALVIGGGVAGPVAALALRRAGIEATVYEAYPHLADGIGGTLALAPNGLAALDLVGARDAVHGIGLPVERTVMSMNGRQVELPRLPGMPPMQIMNRSDLHRALHDVATAQGITVEYGRRLTAVEENGDGVTAYFADGTTASADVLIGCDGVHSIVRTLIDPDAPGPDFTGVLSLESTVDVPTPEEPGTLHFNFGKRAYYLHWPQPDGSTHFGANLPNDTPMRLTEARRVPPEEWLRRLREAYGEDEPGGELVRHTGPDQLEVIGAVHIMPSVPHWHRGRLALAGDAVHAPSNSSGQGASLAIESAIELARCLRDLPDPRAAFAAYERLRRPRVEEIARRAASINQVKAAGPLASALLPFVMRLAMKTVMKPEKTLGPQLRHRIDWDAPVPAHA